MRNQSGAVFTLGKGAICSNSTTQKSNTRSLTELELNGIDEKINKVVRTKRCFKWQKFEVKLNMVYQDNTSTMKLANNGRASTSKCTRHFNIKLLDITDLIGRD